ncbi:hypothetical protein GJV85_02340 [Sulfurimonas aquatica]|uniref:Lipoprotein n=1 Tax=Sulfurimonas aquatica TaxID=2672570 RepID=A0A975AYM8_9BACT|nr:hypothetical protein [Sulfurimonas aquatica]QSZ40999.1 hypothetical protein GJV85_02340 [Sulfurimonas aquatica]
MKKFLLFLILIVAFGMSACSSKLMKNSHGSYERANDASKESIKTLDKDTK